ncbi:hypothetical protein QJQ45_026725 [Haematococcus lacustris]|nr:hypothetical protein QJQ45_026725 [Haematococcus lacustris]
MPVLTLILSHTHAMMLSLKSLCVPCAAKCLRPVCSVPGRLPSARNVTLPSPPASVSTHRHTLVAQPRPRASWHRAAATAAAGSAEAINDPSVDNRIPVTVRGLTKLLFCMLPCLAYLAPRAVFQVITGFLGSGKTTLLNNILTQNHGRRIAVIENEASAGLWLRPSIASHCRTGCDGPPIVFGEIDIDSELVVKQEVVEGSRDTVMQLSNGCLCCTVRDDLIQALNRLVGGAAAAGTGYQEQQAERAYDRRSEFDHIVIETTGLANPAPIISSFFMDRSLPDKWVGQAGGVEVERRVKLDGVVTVVDAKHVSRHLDTPKEAGVVNEAVEQIAFADRILLNKTDLVDAASLGPLEARLQAINKMATITRAQRAQVSQLGAAGRRIRAQGLVEVDYVLGVGGFDLENVERELNITLQWVRPAHASPSSSSAAATAAAAGVAAAAAAASHGICALATATAMTMTMTMTMTTTIMTTTTRGQTAPMRATNTSTAMPAAGGSPGFELHHDHHHHDHDHTGPDCTHESHQHQHSHGQAALVEKHDDKVTSVSLLLEGDMDLDKVNYSLGLLLETRAEDIYRMKGLLSISGSDYRYVYQGVHQIFEGTPDRKWRDGEKRCCKMVFIGRELDQEAFKEAFTFCLTGTLLVLRELFDPHSRFKPYIKARDMVRRILEYQSYLGAVLEGHVNLQLEFTIKEMLGSANVTLDDLKYGCAVIPIFDMSNHKRKCAHTTTALEGGDDVSVVIGEDVEADMELCYPYTPDMRDDHGVLNYGFLPDPEDPPRLLQVDHPEYSPSDSNKPLSEEPFEADSADGYLSEMDRLTKLLDDIQQVDANFDEAAWPASGTDYVFDMLMGLKQRRREAIRYEVARLTSKLEALSAGRQQGDINHG